MTSNPMPIAQRNISCFFSDSNKYLVVMNMNGPESRKSTVDFRVGHGFALKSELITPKTETLSTQITSLGICLVRNHIGIRLQTSIPVGNTQATKIENFSTRGGQLWIAVMEKTTIKTVEKRKTLKVKSSYRANITLDVGSLEFKGMKICRGQKGISLVHLVGQLLFPWNIEEETVAFLLY